MSTSRRWLWLLLFTGMLLQQCRQETQFTLMPAEDTGLTFRNEITETAHNNIMTYEYTYNGGGVAAADINNDGLTDLYFSGNAVPNKLFINKGGWKFEDITRQSNTAGRPDWKTGVTFADVNGDGWQDLYLCYSGNAQGEGFNKPVIMDHPKRANQLFINQGCKPGGVPTFVEQAAQYGLDAPGTFSTQSYFLDMDLDGDLDMFLLNHANMFYSVFFNVKRLRNLRHPYFGNKLYRNDHGRFVEVSAQAGIHGSGLNFGLSAAISDLNFDGWPDIYVTNDYDEQDFCYINKGDGTFKEVSHTLFGHLSKYGMGSDIADINNDGLPDIFVVDMLPEDNHRQKLLKGPDEYDKYSLAVDSGYHHQHMRNTLQVNRGFAPDSLPRFSELGQLAGISNTDWSWAPLFADFDNDGLKDLFITNGYLRDFTNLDFLKYTVGDAVKEANTNNHPLDMLKVIQQMPSTKLTKYAFSNTDGLHFVDRTEAWGLTQKAISNAAVYADLDNDGDLDLVASNLNDEISVLQNHQEKIQQNNYIKIRLAGKEGNTAGIGAKVQVKLADRTISHEAHFSRGYQSSVEPVFTIGIGKATFIEEIDVQWPDQSVSVLKNIEPNQTLLIPQENAMAVPAPKAPVQPPLLKEVTATAGLDFRHQENRYIDFKAQRLVPYQLSRLGGKLAVADVNSDGNDDVFFGGPTGQAGALYFGTDDGRLEKAPSQPWQEDAAYEDTGMTFFDADGDGDADLYVVSGGNEFPPGDPYYQDRLYLNTGAGTFGRAHGVLPAEETSGSCAAAADYDKDGDLDLFVGGRLAAQNYPLFPKSSLLRNDSRDGQVKFTDVASETGEALQLAGMVTDALWSDINNDSWPDLILVGEWMPVRVFRNDKGKLKEITDDLRLSKTQGWWSSISQTDADGDGDMDFLLGNAGLNLQLRASEAEPLTCYMQDINADGAVDPLLCYYIQGNSYPMASRDELLDQVTPLRKKFIKYADYADATVDNILTKEQLASAAVLKVVTLQSSWLENTGGRFSLKALPDLAQVSAANAFVQHDVDHDGKPEIIVAGNFYPYRVQLGKSDASMGLLLKFSEGKASTYLPNAPLWLGGDIRDMAILKFKNAADKIIVSRNNDAAAIFECTVAAEKTVASTKR
ncbi:VCBS repeat-containing protein [Fulvivirgaceae bacterium PWU4]|uniref:VCBS repeat-containing protein n=1 Tax=Chryseosolibacter histidini TaxID=2782349 RepID=A0AAP2DLT5_9BACT|nr:VCBS repeat-containing protein [Chryseosolibacter histidini]MBT1698731.1 VCBS repeat-containing protein [Chryseosolibacter histidini]